MPSEKKSAILRVVERRPLSLFAVAYACGASVEAALRGEPRISGVLLALSAAAFALSRKKAYLFAAAIFLGALLTGWAMITPRGEEIRGAQVNGLVLSVDGAGELHEGFVLNKVTINGEAYPYRIDAYAYGGVAVEPGDRVSFVGSLYPPGPMRNPGGMDEAMVLWKDGIALKGSVSAESFAVTGDGSKFLRFFSRLRGALGARIDALFPASEGLTKALCIGVRDSLPSELRSGFRDMGISHLLAISGLHVECLALFLDFLLRRLRVPKRVSFFVDLLFLAFYACLVGYSPSILRAILMFSMLRTSSILGRPADGMTRLGTAFLILVIARPLNVFDYGFVLSFSAVAGLMLVMPLFNRFIGGKTDIWSRRGKRFAKLVNRVAGMAAVSFVAQLATLPAIATYYGSISPWSVFANLIAVPVSMAVLPLSLVAIGFSYVSFYLGALIAWAPDHLFALLSRTVAAMRTLPFATVALPAWPGLVTALYVVALASMSRFVEAPGWFRRASFLMIPALIACTFVVRFFSIPGGLTVTFLDAGNADVAVVFAERSVYLVDAGDTGSPAADYLSHLGIDSIDGVFLSHPHKDHAAGLSKVLDQARVDTLYVSENFYEVDGDESVTAAVQKAIDMGTRVETVGAGDEVKLSASVALTVVQADESGRNNADDLSMVAHIRYGDGSALFLGDLPKEREGYSMPDADLLKVAHHGSAYNTGELLLTAVTPSVSVIPVGRNGYGHPTEAVLSRLHRSGSAVYVTKEWGAVTASIARDGTVLVKTFLKMEDRGA